MWRYGVVVVWSLRLVVWGYEPGSVEVWGLVVWRCGAVCVEVWVWLFAGMGYFCGDVEVLCQCVLLLVWRCGWVEVWGWLCGGVGLVICRDGAISVEMWRCCVNVCCC